MQAKIMMGSAALLLLLASHICQQPPGSYLADYLPRGDSCGNFSLLITDQSIADSMLSNEGGQDILTIKQSLQGKNGETIGLITFQQEYPEFCRNCEKLNISPFEVYRSLTEKGAAIDGTFVLPVNPPYQITSHWGWRWDPFQRKRKFHYGTDLGVMGPVYSVDNGIVVSNGKDELWGNYIAILHPCGACSFYAHLKDSKKKIVRTGNTVIRGQRIGTVGTTGKSTNIHLHFALFQIKDIEKGALVYINPEPFLEKLAPAEKPELAGKDSHLPMGIGGK